MRMRLKKEVKHSVVYEALEGEKSPIVRSVYVSKEGMEKLSWGLNSAALPGAWPREIDLEVKLP